MSRFWKKLKYKLSWNHIKFVIKDIPNRIRDMFLCWKYPFLRTRNAFSGLEHNWWPARNFHIDNWGKCVRNVFVDFEYDDKFEYDAEITHDVVSVMIHKKLNNGLCIDASCENIYIIYNNKIEHTYDLRNYFKVLPTAIELVVKPENEIGDNIVLKFKGGEVIPVEEYDVGVSRICTVVINRWLYTKIKILDWIEKYPYQWIHFLPTHSWYRAIPYGWRKCFGMQLLKEIARALKDAGGRKAMKSLQITDIKEKWGALQIYTYGCPNEVHKIIEKYEYISRRTCIECGKTAYGLTEGWVQPLCEDCFKKSDYARIRPFYHKDNSWYGYTSSSAKETVFHPDYEALEDETND